MIMLKSLLLPLVSLVFATAAPLQQPSHEVPVDTFGHDLWSGNKNDTEDGTGSYKDTRLVIQIPFHLHNKDGEHHEVARWGGANVPWSGTLAEFVYYYDKPLCHGHIEFNDTAFPFYPTKNAGENMIRPFILMVPSGPCSPVMWARRAQFVGAAALMVAESVCRCNDQTCTDKYSTANCRPAGQPILINDGTAGDISIPVWLVHKEVGQKLIDTVVKDNQPVLVDYSWGLPRTNETDCEEKCDDKKKTVTYQLWTAAAHDPQLTADNIKELQQVVKALGHKVVLEPKFRLLDGTHFNCPSYTDPSSSPCDHLCTNGGRYCAVHQKDLSGHAVVTETLRRLCIWKHYDSKAYWEYWVHHATVCNDPHTYANPDCLKEGMEQAKIDPTVIDDCMKESGDTEKDESNSLLQTMIDQQKISGVVKLPTIAHADTMVPLDHGASAHSLFESVCMHYYWRAKGTNMYWEDIPSVCETCFECTNLIGCLEAGHCVAFDHHSKDHSGSETKPPKDKSSHARRGRRGWHFFWFLVFVGLVGYGYYYYQQQQHGMYNGGTGGGLLGSYMQLSGTD